MFNQMELVLVGLIVGLLLGVLLALFALYIGYDRVELVTRYFEFGAENDMTKLTGGYDQLITLVSQESERLALDLRQIQNNADSDDLFKELSEVIERGMDPIAEALEVLENHTNIKNYIEDGDKSKLKPMKLNNDDNLIAKYVGNETRPVAGLKFNLRGEVKVTNSGETEVFSDFKMAEGVVSNVSGDYVTISTYNWRSAAEADVSELKETLMSKRNPYLEIQTQGLEDIDWSGLEEAHDYLLAYTREDNR
jgi:hypothetical protein